MLKPIDLVPGMSAKIKIVHDKISYKLSERADHCGRRCNSEKYPLPVYIIQKKNTKKKKKRKENGKNRKVLVGNDQEKAQSERNSPLQKTEVGKK